MVLGAETRFPSRTFTWLIHKKHKTRNGDTIQDNGVLLQGFGFLLSFAYCKQTSIQHIIALLCLKLSHCNYCASNSIQQLSILPHKLAQSYCDNVRNRKAKIAWNSIQSTLQIKNGSFLRSHDYWLPQKESLDEKKDEKLTTFTLPLIPTTNQTRNHLP